ncbi:hypothetical protein TNCV_532671 [Trichonephila clavipes]|nr:hypothetical protein TNCV_532671 [Trichonephila clavipes]
MFVNLLDCVLEARDITSDEDTEKILIRNNPLKPTFNHNKRAPNRTDFDTKHKNNFIPRLESPIERIQKGVEWKQAEGNVVT